jgi:hypothetical protein
MFKEDKILALVFMVIEKGHNLPPSPPPNTKGCLKA